MTQPIAGYAYYARPSDDLLIGATVTSSDEDPAYPASNLIAENAANPAKLLTASGSWVLQTPSPIAPVWALLIYQYLDSSLDVRLQGNTSDSWGSPPFEQHFTIPGKRLDGPSYQPWTYNVGLVIEGTPLPSYAFWRLLIAGTNSQAVAVGRMLLLPNPRTVKFLVADQLEESDDYEAQIILPTELGVETIYDLGGPRRGISGVTPVTDASGLPLQDAADFRDLLQSATGRLKPWVIWPFGQSGEPWLVRFVSLPQTRRHSGARVQYWPFAVKEVSRGLPWP